MAISHAQPGEVIDVRSLGSSLATAKDHDLVQDEQNRSRAPRDAAGQRDCGTQSPWRDHGSLPRRQNQLHCPRPASRTDGGANALPRSRRTALGQVHRGRIVLTDDPAATVMDARR